MKTELFKKAKFSSSLLKVVMSLVLVASPFSLVGSALAAPVDSSVPATSITTPTNNSTVSGVVAVSASATDVYSSCVVTVSGQSYDVSSLKSDHSGGDIFVCGTDMTAVYQAVHGTSVSRIASLLIPSNYNGVTQVELYVDNSLVSTDVSTPYSFSLDTTSLSNGVHVLTTKAYDQANNVGTSANVSVTVNNAVVTPVLTSISLTPVTSSVVVGAVQQFTAVAKDQNGVALSPQPTTTYTSSDTAKATVNASGLATGVATGTVTVMATSGSVSSTASLTVTTASPNRVLTTVVVTPTTTGLSVGDSQQLTATALDQFGEPITVALLWSSSNPSVATVDSNGRVTALSVGTTTVTATSGSVGDSATVTVTTPSAPPDKTKILVEMNLGDGKSEIKIKMAGSELEFKLFTTNKTEIVNAIAQKTGLSTSTILSVAEFKVDGADDEHEDENEDVSHHNNNGGMEHESNNGESVNVHEEDDDHGSNNQQSSQTMVEDEEEHHTNVNEVREHNNREKSEDRHDEDRHDGEDSDQNSSEQEEDQDD